MSPWNRPRRLSETGRFFAAEKRGELTAKIRRQNCHSRRLVFRVTGPNVCYRISAARNAIGKSYRSTDRPDRLAGDPRRSRIRSGVFGTRLIRLAVAPSGPSRSPNGTPCRQRGLSPIRDPDHDRVGPLGGGGNTYGKVCSRAETSLSYGRPLSGDRRPKVVANLTPFPLHPPNPFFFILGNQGRRIYNYASVQLTRRSVGVPQASIKLGRRRLRGTKIGFRYVSSSITTSQKLRFVTR